MPEVRTTNLRFNLGKESQRKAWQYLQTMDKSAFKSYSQAVATAVLDWREAWADAVNRALEEKQQCDPPKPRGAGTGRAAHSA